LLILSLTVAVGTFSSVLQTTIERSQLEVSWQEIGADYVITTPAGSPLPPSVDASVVPGTEAVARGLVLDDAILSTGPGSRFETRLQAIEPGAYESVLFETPVELGFPGWFAQVQPGLTPGTPESPIPAVISTRRPVGSQQLALGDAFQVQVGGQPLTFRAGGIADRFPGIEPTEAFVIASLDLVQAATGGQVRPNTLFVRGPAALAPDLAELVGSQIGAPTVASRHDRFATMHDAPLVSAVVGGFTLALAAAGAYAVLAVVAVVILHAQRRSRDTAFLQTLGLTEGQGTSLMVIEYGLPLGIALVLGIAIGLALAWLLAPGLDLAAFSQAGVTVLLAVDWIAVALVALAVALAVGLAIAGASRLARRLELGQVLRAGDV
jgi:hypothetical protein